DVDLLLPVGPTRLEQGDAHPGVGRQTVGQHTAGRAGTDNHVVIHRDLRQLGGRPRTRARSKAVAGVPRRNNERRCLAYPSVTRTVVGIKRRGATVPLEQSGAGEDSPWRSPRPRTRPSRPRRVAAGPSTWR